MDRTANDTDPAAGAAQPPESIARPEAAPIELVGLRKEYPNGTVAVADLSLQVQAGETVVLIGPSGCGKSTVLRMINRLIAPTSGRVLVGGEDITGVNPVALRRRIGYVIQNVGLFPHQSVRANVGTVPRLLGWPKPRVAERADELLDLVGLDARRFGQRYPHELSGGQRQRVGVARALAADPVVLLMDEPFSAVDPIARARLQEEFLRLRERVRTTTVLVTHDIDEAVKLGERIAVLSDGAHLEQYDPPGALLAEPANPFVSEFVGSDRGIKRLAVTPIPRGWLRPVSDVDDDVPTVPAGATLHDALAAMLSAGTDLVLVRDGGQVLGALTPDDVHRALRDTDQSRR